MTGEGVCSSRIVTSRISWWWWTVAWTLVGVGGELLLLLLLIFGFAVDWRLVTEGEDEELDETGEVWLGVRPLVQVGKIDLTIVINMLTNLDLHVWRGFDKAERSVVGVSVQDPDWDGDVVVLTLVWDRNGANNVDQLSGHSIMTQKLLRFRIKTYENRF